LAGIVVAGLVCTAVLAKLGAEQTVLRQSRLDLAKRVMPPKDGEVPEPGPICSREGHPLADSLVRYTIWADPSAYRTESERASMATMLSGSTGVAYHRLYPRLCMSDRDFCYVVRRADRETMARVASLDLPGVHILPEVGRYYPYGPLAANAIGCRGADNIGLEGLELLWAFALDGQPGGPRLDQDPLGRTILGASGRYVPPEPGCRLVLTLRLPLQKVVEAAMDDLWKRNQPLAATCTVLDPRTGDLLALSVRPNYDPNNLKSAQPEMRRCRQAADVYAPGSTLKSIIIAAALDCGAIDANSSFYCPGTITVGDRPLGCWGEWRARGHGPLTPAEIVAHSCNVGAAQVAMRLGPERLYRFIDRMHLRETLSSGLDAERPGSVLPRAQQRVRGIANIGFGQGIDVTDLHMVAWYGALANGGRMYGPNIVHEVRRADGSLVRHREPLDLGQLVKPETAGRMLAFLEGAVESGTGAGCRIPGVRVGGKTGTAQIFDVKAGKHLADEYIMSFIAVAPIQAPRYVVFVRVDRPKVGEHGSDTALPTVKRILEAALRLQPPDEAPEAGAERAPSPVVAARLG
jgi:cell division protein FtsI/penicillin-binding protein 2